jgi:two-component system sensor histidine kinase SenX3
VDRRLIALAIKQLVDNALKYSPPSTPIAIRVKSTDGKANLEITNHGTEISPQEQRRIFDRFYRSPSVHKRIPGSGLGLSIARRIAQAHGGDLTVTSRAGETTFRMRFPVHHEGGESERG